DLTAEIVTTVARAIGTFFRQNNAKTIALGFDARESSPEFCEILAKGLNETGCDVVLIGQVPTPVLYHTVYTKDVDGGVMITGSHNPASHNGFKICLGKQTLFGSQIREISEIAFANNFREGNGSAESASVLDKYGSDIISRIDLGKRRVKIVIDAGNGMGGVTAAPIYRELGAKVVELYTNPDSSFPNHPPDPAVSDNLQDLIDTVQKQHADLGVAFDGDADRITVVTHDGRIVWGDELTILFARQILKQNPGAAVIGEVKCSQTLFDEVERLGGKALMCKAGHSIVKAKMQETGALLAGEMSGHIFFADRYYGFDDACYAGARLLEILSKTDKKLSELLSDLPKTVSTDEIRIPCREEDKFEIPRKIAGQFEATNEVITVDGARISFENGWGLVRASNTQAIIVCRFEADTEASLSGIQKMVESRVRDLIKKSL
ncbi:MAG: phosphomannomutase/phosphoglucomutase, partial [Pyrinomonadaceae bacterium]|nr:phosphomannomutase/phosphoglucomutase [Pyrinomonadaceae bacterium]